MAETAEELSKQSEVRHELARATGQKAEVRVKAKAKDKFWFVTHGLVLLGSAILYILSVRNFCRLR